MTRRLKRDSILFSVAMLLLGVCRGAAAHDTWVQTNTNTVRAGDVVFVDLLLGNHGNDHRDFKMAGKPDRAASRLEVIAPGGSKYDINDRLIDRGYAPSEGYWSARFVPAEVGLHLVAHSMDKVVSYAPTRSVKSAKAYFLVSSSLDHVEADKRRFDEPLGHPLELVPKSHPVTPMGPGSPIDVQVLYKGRPLADARVSFVPRGETLSEGFDDRYERKTDADGRASFTPAEGNYYLVVVHHVDPRASGPGYESTKYSATLTVLVPQVCPCCLD
ncbi:MAG TPA: DUF4198 domain-containing protein [Pirellulales bacterium]|nr:DUF4198 domain-containing protein [Pirellulales bacterium]